MCKQHFNGCGIQGLDTGQCFTLDGNTRPLWERWEQGGEQLGGTAVAAGSSSSSPPRWRERHFPMHHFGPCVIPTRGAKATADAAMCARLRSLVSQTSCHAHPGKTRWTLSSSDLLPELPVGQIQPEDGTAVFPRIRWGPHVCWARPDPSLAWSTLREQSTSSGSPRPQCCQWKKHGCFIDPTDRLF